MFLEDSPINKSSEDLLNRSTFSKKLSEFLMSTNVADGYCVALFGPWGSGKSSIVNMTMETLEKRSDASQQTVIMKFNPWYYASTGQLIHIFMKELADHLANSGERNLKRAADLLSTYSTIFGLFSEPIGKAGSLVADMVKHRSLYDGKDMTDQHNKIVNALSKYAGRIIVVIDDIDRLSDEEIRMIFQLVSAVCKFPKVIYLLAFDKDIVVRALNNVQGYDGERYLEKIVQVPVYIPDAKNTYIWSAFDANMNTLRQSFPSVIFEELRWCKVWRSLVSEYVGNIRDIIRLTNALEFKLSLIDQEVNFADLVGVTIIELKIPKLYEWIKLHRALLLGSDDTRISLIGQKNIYEYYLQNLKEVDKKQAEKYLFILSCFFPFVDDVINHMNTYVLDDRTLRHIGNTDFFERYFDFEVDQSAIKYSEFKACVMSSSKEEIGAYLKKISKSNGLINFLKELDSSRKMFSQERLGVLIQALAENYELFMNFEPSKEILSYRLDMCLYLSTVELLKLIDDVYIKAELVAKCQNILSLEYNTL